MINSNTNSRVEIFNNLRLRLEHSSTNNFAQCPFDKCLRILISLESSSFNNTSDSVNQLTTEFTDAQNVLLTSSNRRNAADQFRIALIQAEYQRLQSNNYKAVEQYDNAIEYAKYACIFTEAALAAELAAGFLIDWGRHNHSTPYINDAQALYNRAIEYSASPDAVSNYNIASPDKTKPTLTKNRQTTQSPSNNHTNYKQLVEDAVDVIWSADLNGYFNYLSPQWESLFGFDPTKSLGTVCLDYVHEEDLESIKTSLINLYLGNKPKNKEFRHRCADGTYIWIMVSATVISDAHGNDIGTQGTLRDISDKKEMELELQNASTRLQNITENLPCVIVRHTFDVDGKLFILHIGPQCKQMFEVDADAALNDSSLLLQHIEPSDLQHISNILIQCLANLDPYQVEFRVSLPDKGRRWYQSTCTPTRTGDGQITLDGIITDVTQRKLTELELQRANDKLATASKMKDTFLSNMNHELRTPLTAIMSINEGLHSGMLGPCTPAQAEWLAVIHESSNHLLDLINELIDLSDIEAGSADLHISNINVEQLCQTCFKLVLPQAREKSIELVLQISSYTGDLMADRKRVRQILVNLLQNAIKFSSYGEPITLSANHYRPDKSEKSYIRFSVIDTGMGMDESELPFIYEPFHQIQTKLNRSYQGMGLGLALVKRYTELHAGHISVKSKVGAGSCFNIDLPLCDISTTSQAAPTVPLTGSLAEPQSALADASQVSALKNKKANRQQTILLAEDNNSVAMAMQKYLQFNQYVVVRTNNGDSAVKIASDEIPDIVLMDIQMPGVDGIEAIQRMRRIPKLAKTLIVAVTGLACEESEKRCIDAGANHYLCKPYRMQCLVDLLQNIAENTLEIAPEITPEINQHNTTEQHVTEVL